METKGTTPVEPIYSVPMTGAGVRKLEQSLRKVAPAGADKLRRAVPDAFKGPGVVPIRGTLLRSGHTGPVAIESTEYPGQMLLLPGLRQRFEIMIAAGGSEYLALYQD